MLDINLLRNDPERVKENIRKKFQDQKLPLVDEVVAAWTRNTGSPRPAGGRACATSATPFQQADRRPDGQGPEGRGRGHQGQGSRPWPTSLAALEQKEE